MFSVDVKVGRLLEVRLVTPVTLQDLESAQEHLNRLFQQHGKVVLVADYTRATVFSQEVAAKLLGVFKAGNDRVERSAALVSSSAVFSLQVERLIAQAGNPMRRSFHDRFELKSFLGAALSHEEHVRLVQFLAEKPGGPSSP